MKNCPSTEIYQAATAAMLSHYLLKVAFSLKHGYKSKRSGNVKNNKKLRYSPSHVLVLPILTSDSVSVEGRGSEHVVHSVGVQHERGIRDVMLPGSLGQYFENEYIFKKYFCYHIKNIFFRPVIMRGPPAALTI